MRKMGPTITNLQILRPAFELDQKESMEWLAAVHAEAAKEPATLLALLKKIGLGDQKIKKRGVSITDCFHQNWDEMEIYHASKKPSGACMGKRGEVFDRVTSDILERFYPEGSAIAPHLVHVTCTGYIAPSPAQKLVSLRNRGNKTQVTHAY